ncbi:MAG TPA: MFS transporter, partial [Gemmatimonadales bacterium]|nr:MFS transporter [Gemmatimonadales bacterium]
MPGSGGQTLDERLTRALRSAVDLRPGEARPLLLAAGYFFFVLASYYILRPLREEMGVAGGVDNLAWLFTGSLVTMLALHAPFAALVARLPRRRFVALTNRFFLANLLLFFVALRLLPPGAGVWAGRVYFVWTSVFNLFVVSVFWAVMVDVFDAGQGRRLFGFIALGGTLGGITGAGLTAALARPLGPVYLLLCSAALLELGVRCVLRLTREPRSRGARPEGDPEAPIGGSVAGGVAHVVRSPYLLGICGYMMLFTLGSTVLYFHQARLAEATFTDSALRTAFFARLDLVVNLLTALGQMFATGRLLTRLGVALTMTLLPALSLAGFLLLGVAPVLGVFVTFQVLRRAAEYAVAKPTRELLYTVITREDKYKAKNFIDTFVYRAGDQIAAWSYTGLLAAGLGMAAVSFVMAPVAAVWLVLALWLGRRQA